jgi:hypothetical protein
VIENSFIILPQLNSNCKNDNHYHSELEKLQHYRGQKSLSLCLELLEKHGISGDVAIFVLSAVGGEG